MPQKLPVLTCSADGAVFHLTPGALDLPALQAWIAAHVHDGVTLSFSEMGDRRSGTDRRKGH